MVIHPIGPQVDRTPHLCHREAIQAEVARQLAGFDQRAQVQDAEILRLRRELDEAARREQEMREHVRREREVANNAPLPRVAQRP